MSQQAWIQNMTVRENILFAKSYDSIRYKSVVESCALQPDFELLTGGDSAEIGERVRAVSEQFYILVNDYDF